MNVEEYHQFCLSLKGAKDSTPFGPEHLVIKVLDKMFALFDLELFTSINLKCKPEYAIELREKHDFVLPGYHMNKKHWNTITNPENLTNKFLMDLTIHSYECVVEKMTKKEKDLLKEL